MRTTLIVLAGVAVIAVFVALLLTVIISISRRAAAKAQASAAADPHLVGLIHIAPALFGGGGGEGASRVVGNGVIGLSRNEAVFVLGSPRKVITIPRAAITDVTIDTTLRVPGRIRKGWRPWLMIRWSDSAGSASVAGFLLAEPARWRAELLGEPHGL